MDLDLIGSRQRNRFHTYSGSKGCTCYTLADHSRTTTEQTRSAWKCHVTSRKHRMVEWCLIVSRLQSWVKKCVFMSVSFFGGRHIHHLTLVERPSDQAWMLINHTGNTFIKLAFLRWARALMWCCVDWSLHVTLKHYTVHWRWMCAALKDPERGRLGAPGNGAEIESNSTRARAAAGWPAPARPLLQTRARSDGVTMTP